MSIPLLIAFALVLFGAGLFLLEFFFWVGGSFLFGLGIVFLGFGIFMTFSYGPSPAIGYATLAAVFIGLPLVLSLLIRVFPKSLRRRMFLQGPLEDATIAAMPVHLELESLRGRIGLTISSLRPSGVVEFDGKRVDCMSEGMMIEPGQRVKCIEVKPGRVIVRQLPAQDPRVFERDFPS